MSVHKADCVFVCSADGHKQTLLTVALAYADYISAFFSKKISRCVAAFQPSRNAATHMARTLPNT